MTLAVGAVVYIDDRRLWFPHDATTALRTCVDATRLAPVRAAVHWGATVSRGTDVVGRVVEIAERLVAVAHPGEVVCSCAVWRRAEGEFEVSEIGLVDLPGNPLPLAVVRIAGQLTSA